MEDHHSAFLVGKISNVVPCLPTPGNDEAAKNRYLIQFSEFARVNIPNCWAGDRNPIVYRSLGNLGIDLSTLKWEPMTKSNGEPEPSNDVTPIQALGVNPLTMAEAKRGLALTFNVPPEAIEITIRG